MTSQNQFDVFLAHNSDNKPQVRRIADALKERNLFPWLDEEQIPPGKSFQDEIQKAIPISKSAAIFIGTEGLGRWQSWELRTLITQCVNKGIPVITVLLPGVNNLPEHLLFLQEFRWIEFKDIDDARALNLLEWGITEIKPSNFEFTTPIQKELNVVNSVLSINYDSLDYLLKAEKFQEADEETKNILLSSLEKKIDEGLGVKEIRSLSSDILLTIDELWMRYSNQKFGFSKQRSIWQNLLSPQKGFMSQFSLFKKNKSNNSDKDNWYQFATDVGWYHTNPRTSRKEWITYTSLDFSLNAPEGCFPYFRNWWEAMGFAQHDPGRCIALMEQIDKFIK